MKRRFSRASRPSTPPQKVALLVDPVFRSLKLDESARSFRAQRAFAKAAGPRLRRVARADKLRGGTLYVRVSSSAWSQELFVYRTPLLDKIRRIPGGEAVEDLRFSVGPFDELPEWETEAPPAEPAQPPAPAPPPAPDPEVERALGKVTDPELRDALSAWLRSQRS